ncbi:tetratricopeptide repeat protein [Rhodococcus hoagii]|nr:tetratricopeptide repeat protein [Prescottella equi]
MDPDEFDHWLQSASPVSVADSIVEAFDSVSSLALSAEAMKRHVLLQEGPRWSVARDGFDSVGTAGLADVSDSQAGLGFPAMPSTGDECGQIGIDAEHAASDEGTSYGFVDADGEVLRTWIPFAENTISSSLVISEGLALYLDRQRALAVEGLDVLGELRSVCSHVALDHLAAAARYLHTEIVRCTDSSVISGNTPTDMRGADEVDPVSDECRDLEDLELYVVATDPERSILARRIWERLRYDAVLTVLAHEAESTPDDIAVLESALDGFLGAGLEGEAIRSAEELLASATVLVPSPTLGVLDDFDGAVQAIDRARTVFEDLSRPDLAADAILALGEACLAAGWHERAEEALCEASSQYTEWLGVEQVAACAQRLGELYQQSGRYEAAEQEVLRARGQFAGIADLISVADCDHALTAIHESLDRYSDAEDSALRARAIYAENGCTERVADADHNLGVAYRAMERIDEAEDAFRRALAGYEEAGCEERVAGQHLDLGALYFVQGRLDEAECEFLLARERFVGDELSLFPGYNLDVAKCDRNLGIVYMEMFRNEDAAESFTGAREVFQHWGTKGGVADCDLKLGIVLGAMGMSEAAESHILAAHDGYRDLGEAELVATCLVNLGVARGKVDDYRGAEQAYLEARRDFSMLGMPENVAEMDLKLGVVYAGAGFLDEARGAFLRSRGVFEALGMRERAADCTHNLGLVWRPSEMEAFAFSDVEPSPLFPE